ncbi:MAG: Smr/MutS family protein, partial [Balneolaceae bacterium]|nr:Smr/MutS family protein [Balneolaceae bacterium]
MELQEQLLEKARAVLGEAKGNLEELINELESKAQEAEKIKQKYDQLKQKTNAERSRYEEKRSAIEKERDKIREKALKEAEEIVKTANQRIEEAVERIVEKGKKDKEEISKARREVKELKTDVKEEIEDLEQQKKERLRESTEPPEVGDQVRLQDAKTTGELVEVNDGRAVVETGGFRLKTDYGNLVKVEDMSGGKKKKEDRVQVNISRSDFSKQMSPSLNLRGMRGGEAVQELTRYLDKAIAAGRNQVEIIHGKGEGILKKLVHEYLDKRKEVTDYELAPPDRGGAGCTIVYL